MANALYPKTKKRFMAGDIDLTAVAVYAALINVSGAGTTYAYSATHASLTDVPSGAIIATSPALTASCLTTTPVLIPMIQFCRLSPVNRSKL